MSWLLFESVDRVLLGISLCVLLLLAGLVRSWSLLRGFQAAQTELEERAADQSSRLEHLQRRMERVEVVSEARQADARIHHEEDVVEVLDSLLRFNESLRPSSRGASRSGDAS